MLMPGRVLESSHVPPRSAAPEMEIYICISVYIIYICISVYIIYVYIYIYIYIYGMTLPSSWHHGI